MLYEGNLRYSTPILMNRINKVADPIDSYEIQLTVTFEDSKLTNASSFNGIYSTRPTYGTGHFNGVWDFRFKDAPHNYVKYTGDILFNHEIGKEDHFTGRLETVDLLIDGSIRINYVNNISSSPYFGVFPCSLEINGLVADKQSNQVKLDGSILVTIDNANSFDRSVAYTSTNFLKGTVVLNGTLQGNNTNKFINKIIFEQQEWEKSNLS